MVNDNGRAGINRQRPHLGNLAGINRPTVKSTPGMMALAHCHVRRAGMFVAIGGGRTKLARHGANVAFSTRPMPLRREEI